MADNDNEFNNIAKALFADYSVIWYVNGNTGRYRVYSAASGFAPDGDERDDFFGHIAACDEINVCEEDRPAFIEAVSRDALFSAVKNGRSGIIRYRAASEKGAVYHMLKILHGPSGTDGHFILGDIDIDDEVRLESADHSVYNHIAESLAADYDSLFYVDLNDSSFQEFSANDKYKDLKVPTLGKDFFAETRDNVRRYVYPDDIEFAEKHYYKDEMLKELGDRRSFTYKYRLMVDGMPTFYRFTVIRADENGHLIVCVKDINDEVTAEAAMKVTKIKSVTYGQIAESLASNYDVLYYVDISTGRYVTYMSNAIYGNLEIREEGIDFFSEAIKNASNAVHPKDKDRVLTVLGKDYLISALHDKKQFSTDYRLLIDGAAQYTRLTVMWSSDKVHFIIGVENVDDEVRKEKEQLQALNMANEMARRDELTGTKNKTAYAELERSVQNNIENGLSYLPFAIVVCDINGLKQINDSDGHQAGDEYIRAAAKLICSIFAHSPVFRIGGDEFVVFLRGSDYPKRAELLDALREQVAKNSLKDGEPVVASGIAEFDPASDKGMSEVFDRADNMMYANKRELKERACSELINEAAVFFCHELFGDITEEKLYHKVVGRTRKTVRCRKLTGVQIERVHGDIVV